MGPRLLVTRDRGPTHQLPSPFRKNPTAPRGRLTRVPTSPAAAAGAGGGPSRQLLSPGPVWVWVVRFLPACANAHQTKIRRLLLLHPCGSLGFPIPTWFYQPLRLVGLPRIR